MHWILGHASKYLSEGLKYFVTNIKTVDMSIGLAQFIDLQNVPGIYLLFS